MIRYVDALHICIDGNFHFNLKPKHTDPNDFPLTKASSYFVHEDDFKYYILTTKPYPNEVCSGFILRFLPSSLNVWTSPRHAASSLQWVLGNTKAPSRASSR